MQRESGLFRRVALERLSTPERLDELMQVTTPRGWLVLLAFCGVVAAALVWGLYGSIPTTVPGQGILIREGSIQAVESPASGQVTDVYVRTGDAVRQDQVVARVFQQGDASREGASSSRAIFVTSSYAGRVLEVRVIRGNVIQAGTELLNLEIGGRALEAVVYLPPVEAKKVQPGMEVQLSPAQVKREEYGMLLARVVDVGQFPASPAAMRRVLGSDELVKALSSNGAPIEVHAELERSPRTISGYQWTSTATSAVAWLSALAGPWLSPWLAPAVPPWLGTWFSEMGVAPGPPITLESGTPCQASVVVEERAPIYLVLARFYQSGR